MAEHISVLVGAVLEAFARLRDDAVVVDGTVGLGGHAQAILDAHPRARIIGLDKDDAALSRAAERLRGSGRAALRHASFGSWPVVIRELGLARIDGLLLDLGVSSLQLDSPARGFSFRAEGPLDMRMDPSMGLSVAEFLAGKEAPEIAQLLREFGEEKLAWPIAKAIVRERDSARLSTTGQLAEICRRVYPRGHQRIDPATRTFQALRIAVNDELGELTRALDAVPTHTNVGGVVCVISFHSLEDRIAKQRFAQWEREGLGRTLKRKPITADESEVALNPRASSAKLRAFVWGEVVTKSNVRRSKHHR
jgi:16S rRNA (cytosine1402-N4)-methyltransferase